MNKAELRQKLEAVRNVSAEKYRDEDFKQNPEGYTVAPYCNSDATSTAFEAGFDTLLPLLLDAYEALDKVSAVAVCRVITPKEEHGQMLDNCLNISEEALAHIEAFVNGEK